MRTKIGNKLVARWAASFLSVVLLLSMVAAPALAYVAASQVVSSSIKDGSILNRDIRANVISSSRVKDNTLLNRDIHENVISSSRIRNGTIQDIDIAPGAAIADSKIAYSNKIKQLSMHASAFRPKKNTYGFENGNVLFSTAPAAVTNFYATVYLPHGAVVTGLHYSFKDNSSTYNTKAVLYRFGGGIGKPMADTGESGGSPSVYWQSLTDNSITYSTIDNAQYSYYARIDLHGSAGSNLMAGDIIVAYEVVGP